MLTIRYRRIAFFLAITLLFPYLDLEDQSGISSSLTTEAVREYTELAIMEREREWEKEKSSYKTDGK